ncbi:MAG TPA: glycosyltransferase [Allosphingosinicella sp.]
MLRVLTLASLYPTAERPTFGLFVERETRELAAIDEVDAQIVSPIGVPPWPLSLHPHYSARRRLPSRQELNGLIVHRPRFRSYPGPLGKLNGKAMARAVLPLLRELRHSFPFDVIDAEFFWPDGVAAMHLGAALGVPFSIKARGSDVHLWGRTEGVAEQILEAGRRADGLLAVSGALKSDMAALGMPEQNIRILYTGIDLDQFHPANRATAKKALGIEGPLLLTAGALIPLKGQALAIDALEHLPQATLILAGEGPERTALERRAARFGGRVRFVGGRPHEEVARLMAAADVLVHPSEREGLANVWLEALASGTPIVISDAGGAREIVDRGEAGRVVDRDPRAIAEAVEALLADPPAQAEVRKSAERFSWAKNRQEQFDYLSGLVRDYPSRPRPSLDAHLRSALELPEQRPS